MDSEKALKYIIFEEGWDLLKIAIVLSNWATLRESPEQRGISPNIGVT